MKHMLTTILFIAACGSEIAEAPALHDSSATTSSTQGGEVEATNDAEERSVRWIASTPVYTPIEEGYLLLMYMATGADGPWQEAWVNPPAGVQFQPGHSYEVVVREEDWRGGQDDVGGDYLYYVESIRQVVSEAPPMVVVPGVHAGNVTGGADEATYGCLQVGDGAVTFTMGCVRRILVGEESLSVGARIEQLAELFHDCERRSTTAGTAYECQGARIQGNLEGDPHAIEISIPYILSAATAYLNPASGEPT